MDIIIVIVIVWNGHHKSHFHISHHPTVKWTTQWSLSYYEMDRIIVIIVLWNGHLSSLYCEMDITIVIIVLWNWTERKQIVSITGYSSIFFPALLRGVPQSSVLSPILFLLYTRPLSQVIDKHLVSHREIADDRQLFDLVPHEQLDSLLSNMQSCVGDVKLWMTQNKLQLNEGKTEALLIDPQNSPNLPLNHNRSKLYLFFKISPESRCDFWWQAPHETTS